MSTMTMFILALSATSVTTLPAAALTSSDVSASLSVINGNVSTTLNFTGAAPTIVTSQNLNGTAGRISFDQIRVLGHDSAVSATVGSSNIYSSLPAQSTLEMYTMAQPSGFTVVKPVNTGALTGITKPYISLCWWGTSVFNTSFVYICTASIANPNLHTVVAQPTLSLNGSQIVKSDGVWSGGTPEHTLFACGSSSAAQTAISSTPKSSCNRLATSSTGAFGVPANLSSAWVLTNGWVAYNSATHGSNIVLQSSPGSSQFVWTAAVQFSGGLTPSNPVGAGASAAPKYSGPEFSSFGSATLAGNKLVTSGKKLDTITSMKLNGTAVTYKINSASELEIDLPKDLAPGKYDVEINSVHGKLTHLQGITIKAVVPTNELAFKAEGAWLNYGSLLELTNIAKQIGSEYTSVKCIVNAADPVLAERLAKRACSYLEANRLRGKAVTHESKSTYKGEGFWVRVVANG